MDPTLQHYTLFAFNAAFLNHSLFTPFLPISHLKQEKFSVGFLFWWKTKIKIRITTLHRRDGG
jgi:hypothetical protein